MSNLLPTRRRAKPSEDGYMLLAVVFLLTLLTLALSIAVPRMSKAIQRDREVETMHRGKQYIRGIQLYYRKFHAYPPSVDALVKTNEIRFLRKRYIDPMTGKDDWKPILFGQNKAPTAMGFFGQPLSTGGSIAGIGPSGGNGLNGASGMNGAGGMNGLNGSSSGGGLFNSSPGGASPFDSSNSGSNPTTPSGSPSTAAQLREPRGPARERAPAWVDKPAARPSAAQASSASLPPALNRPSWSTRKRNTTTSGNSSMTRSWS